MTWMIQKKMNCDELWMCTVWGGGGGINLFLYFWVFSGYIIIIFKVASSEPLGLTPWVYLL